MQCYIFEIFPNSGSNRYSHLALAIANRALSMELHFLNIPEFPSGAAKQPGEI